MGLEKNSEPIYLVCLRLLCPKILTMPNLNAVFIRKIMIFLDV